MEKILDIYGFKVTATYDIQEGRVCILKTSILESGNVSSLDGLDIVSTCEEMITKERKDG